MHSIKPGHVELITNFLFNILFIVNGAENDSVGY